MEEINYCRNLEDVFESETFKRLFNMLLNANPLFSKKYHLDIFKKIGNEELLEKKEIEDLDLFLENEKINKDGNIIIKQLKDKHNFSLDFGGDDIDSIGEFKNFITNILSDNGFEEFKLIINKSIESTIAGTNEILKEV